MKITVSHHIFASSQGYQTQFRSGDITKAENSELESFSFGQTNAPEYLKSLSDYPAYVVRKLASARWAITRVFQGPDDEYNRTTLLFHSVLLKREDWISRLGCDVRPLIFHPTIWQDKTIAEISVEVADLTVPQHIETQVRSLLNKITISVPPVIVDESACSLDILVWANRLMLDEEKDTFTYGYRALTDSLDVALICLAKQAVRIGSDNRTRADVKRRQLSRHDFCPVLAREDQRGSKKVLVLVIFACVIGILGSIYALRHFVNAQSERYILAIKQEADTLLNEKLFAKKLSEQATHLQAINLLRKKIETVLKRKSNEELNLLQQKLGNRINELTSLGKEYDRINSIILQIEEHRQIEKRDYPDAARTKQFRECYEQLIAGEANETFDKQTNDRIREAIQMAIAWRDNAKSEYLEPIKNDIDRMANSLNQCDPNRYTYFDPDGSQLPSWADPHEFLVIVEPNIINLREMKLEIASLRSSPTLRNGTQSSIGSHKTFSESLEVSLGDLQGRNNAFVEKFTSLQNNAQDIKRCEDELMQENTVTWETFYKALVHYDRFKNGNLPSPWLSHYRLLILKTYGKKLEPTLKSTSENSNIPGAIERLYNNVKKSSLCNDVIFTSLYEYHDTLQEKKKPTETKANP